MHISLDPLRFQLQLQLRLLACSVELCSGWRTTEFPHPISIFKLYCVPQGDELQLQLQHEGCLPQGNVRWKTIEQTLAIFTQLCSTLLRFLLRTLMVNITSHRFLFLFLFRFLFRFLFLFLFRCRFRFNFPLLTPTVPLFCNWSAISLWFSDFPLSSAFLHSFLASLSPLLLLSISYLSSLLFFLLSL